MLEYAGAINSRNEVMIVNDIRTIVVLFFSESNLGLLMSKQRRRAAI